MVRYNKSIIIYFHIGFWVILLIQDALGFFTRNLPIRIELVLCYLMSVFIPFYINYFFLVPIILKKSNILNYCIWFILYLSIFVLIHASWGILEPIVFDIKSSYDLIQSIYVSIYVGFLYGFVSTGLRLVLHLFENLEVQQKLMLQKTQTQIQWMKANVNIPFLINTLSFAEDKARNNPGSIQETIISLSNVLRYGLYDSHNEEIDLSRELEAMKEYMSLINATQTSFKVHCEINKMNSCMVPPNLMVKFLGIWNEKFSNQFSNEANVKAKLDMSEGIKFSLPINSNNKGITPFIDHPLPNYDGSNFLVKYLFENDHVVLSIKSRSKFALG